MVSGPALHICSTSLHLLTLFRLDNLCNSKVLHPVALKELYREVNIGHPPNANSSSFYALKAAAYHATYVNEFKYQYRQRSTGPNILVYDVKDDEEHNVAVYTLLENTRPQRSACSRSDFLRDMFWTIILEACKTRRCFSNPYAVTLQLPSDLVENSSKVCWQPQQKFFVRVDEIQTFSPCE